MKHLLKALLLAAALLLPAASALAEYRTVEIESLRIVVDTDWAAQNTPGYFPLRLDITNSGDNRELRIVGSSSKYFNMYKRGRYTGPSMMFGGPSQMGSLSFSQTIRLKRGDRVNLTIPVPIMADNENMSLRIWENGKPLDGFTSNTNTQSAMDAVDGAILFVADSSGPFAAQAASWARPVSAGSGTRYYTPPPPPGSRIRSALPRLDFLLDPVRVPSNWLGFTSLRAVAIGPMEWGQLTPSQKEAILAWTAAGGDLLLVDSSIDTVLPAESRPAGLRTTNPAYNNYYLGHIHLLKSADIVDEAGMTAALGKIGIASPYGDWTLPANRAMDWGWIASRGFRLPIDGVGGIPTKAYLSMLVVFSVLIGPLNYLYLWRKRQQVLLVLTVPLLSLLFIVVLATYGFLGEGFAVRGRAATFTILDQTTRQAATRASVSMYSGGITPGGGLTFPSRAAIYPIGTDGIGVRGQATLDLTDSQQFSQGLLQARSPSNYEQIMFGPARERLTIERSGNEFTVVNGMGGDVTQLYYRDSDHIYSLNGKLAAGQKGSLRPGQVKGADVFAAMNGAALHMPKFQNTIDTQPNGTYLAVLEKSPFWDPGLSRFDEKASLHLVLGYVGGVQ